MVSAFIVGAVGAGITTLILVALVAGLRTGTDPKWHQRKTPTRGNESGPAETLASSTGLKMSEIGLLRPSMSSPFETQEWSGMQRGRGFGSRYT